MLKQAYFPLLIKADLSNLEGYSYFERIFILERLDENEALNIIKKLAKNKALSLNKISNKILKRVVDIIFTLITKIF
jgi:hypothetical protein